MQPFSGFCYLLISILILFISPLTGNALSELVVHMMNFSPLPHLWTRKLKPIVTICWLLLMVSEIFWIQIMTLSPSNWDAFIKQSCHVFADSLTLDMEHKNRIESISSICLNQLNSMQQNHGECISDIQCTKEQCLQKDYMVYTGLLCFICLYFHRILSKLPLIHGRNELSRI